MIDQKKKKITDESFGFCILIFVFGVWKALTSELSSFRCSVITVTRGNYNFCGSLNEKGPHRFIGSGTSRRCGLVGRSRLQGWALRFQVLKPGPVSLTVPAACQSRHRIRSCLSIIRSACV